MFVEGPIYYLCSLLVFNFGVVNYDEEEIMETYGSGQKILNVTLDIFRVCNYTCLD